MKDDAKVLHYVLSFLRICPYGLSGKLLLNMLIEQGIDQDVAGKTLLMCLTKGDIQLNSEMRLCINNVTNAS